MKEKYPYRCTRELEFLYPSLYNLVCDRSPCLQKYLSVPLKLPMKVIRNIWLLFLFKRPIAGSDLAFEPLRAKVKKSALVELQCNDYKKKSFFHF